MFDRGRQFVPVSMAVPALIDFLIAFFALYAAICVRFDVPLLHLRELERELGELWPRAAVCAFVVIGCLAAFGH